MSRSKILLIASTSIIGVGGLIFAGYEYTINRDQYTPSVTSSNSDIHGAMLTGNDDLAPIGLYGSQKIDIDDNIYFQDDGLQTIYFPRNTKAEDISSYAIKWLTNPQQQSNLSSILIKQATLQVQGGDTITLHNGSGLASHILAFNATISTSGDDLIITADPLADPTHKSILLIKKDNPTNYTAESPSDRFGKGLFMISKDNYAIMQIQWNDFFNDSLSYKNGKETYDIYNKDNVNIPQNTNLTFTCTTSHLPSIYHINIGTGKTDKIDNLLQDIEKDKNKGIATIIKTQEKTHLDSILSYEKISPNSSGEYNFTTSPAASQYIIVVSNAIYKIYQIHNDQAFSPTFSDAGNNDNPYIENIISSYQLDTDSITASLKKILGSGTRDNNIRVTAQGLQFSYKIQPKKAYTGTVEIKSIFGQTANVPLSLYIDKISPKVIVKQILANNTMSILPSSGSFQEVLVQHDNIDTFPVEFQACTISSNIDTKTNKGIGLENYLFRCSGKVYTQQVTTKDFVYRHAYRTPVSLPSNFTNTTAFKVTIPGSDQDGNEISHYFLKSDIGIWTKVAGNQLHVRGFTFEDNKPITNGLITVSYVDGGKTTTQTISSSHTTITLPKGENGNVSTKPLLVQLSNGTANSFVIVSPLGRSEWTFDNNSSKTINSYVDPSDITSTNNNIDFRGDTETTKIYGYSDRGMYKAGDTIYFAGFVRDLTTFDNLDYLKGQTVSVNITDTQGNSLYSTESLPIDVFGGFTGSASIPSSLAMGDAIISYTYNKDSRIRYSHNIKIQEYQKPTFFADIDYQNNDGEVGLSIKPQYYFGQPLNNYDAKITWSLAGKDSCAYCRRQNTEKYYYNFTFNDTISKEGDITLYNQKKDSNTHLFAQSVLEQKGYNYTLKATVIIRDKNSDETQLFTKYIDFKPDTKIGLSGQPYEWLYTNSSKDTKKGFTIDGEIAAGKDKVEKLRYELYYKSYDTSTEQGVDASTYYINNTEYASIGSGDLEVKNDFTINTSFIKDPGSYLVRVYGSDKNNTIVGEVQKQIEYYDFTQDSDGLLGALPNNYALTVSVPKKTYEEGDTIPVDIEPYQKGAQVVMTVERGKHILETIEKTLDGSQLGIQVKKGDAPNIIINVMEIVGTDKSTSSRKEPRFFAGYGQADISTHMHQLNISVKTDKQTYKPGDKVTLSISTTDSKGNLVDARVSLGVIDEALISLYDLIKEPLPYFFNKLGTNIFNYTNMKLLYQSLRAFANNGSKGGGGNGGQAMFSMIRDDLKDTAFWAGGIQTIGGKAEVSFTLPDNLTTWVIDTIGITKDTKLGTARTTIISSKDLVIEPNAPQFFTLGDTINVPVKMIVAPSALTNASKIKGTASLTNEQGETIQLGDFSAKPNSKVIIPITINKARGTSRFVTLHVSGTFGDETDSIAQTIPLRTEGLISKDSVGVINKAGDHTFTMPAYTNGKLTMTLSTFPTNMIDAVIGNNIFNGYNTTEQLIAQALTIKNVKELHKNAAFSSNLIQGDKINTNDGMKNMNDVIQDNISQALAHQQTNGSFGSWDNTNTNNSPYKYALSTYIYGGLLKLRNDYSAKKTLDSAITSLESYLWTYRTTSEPAFMWYLMQKSRAGISLTEAENKELSTINPLKVTYGGLLRYAIAVYQHDNDNSKKWKEFATIPTNQDYNETSLLINQISAYSLKAEVLSNDSASTQDERMEALQNIIGSRTKQGDRGNTLTNNDALTTIVHLVGNLWNTKKNITCSVTLQDKTQTVTVPSESGVVMTQPISDTNIHAKRSCDSALIADTYVTYIPNNLTDLLGANDKVTQMNYTIANPKAAISEITTMNGSRTTTLAGEQLVVNMYIPATYKLLNTIISQNALPSNNFGRDPQNIPFTVGNYQCTPSHRETRFDRLFLYYDTLPPSTCDVSIPLIKAYDGSATIMPMTVSELYKGKVNGRKVILQ